MIQCLPHNKSLFLGIIWHVNQSTAFILSNQDAGVAVYSALKLFIWYYYLFARLWLDLFIR